MTNQDIETFFAVLDHGTMTAAAEALYITQPSLSARLKSLEDQVGAPCSTMARASAASP